MATTGQDATTNMSFAYLFDFFADGDNLFFENLRALFLLVVQLFLKPSIIRVKQRPGSGRTPSYWSNTNEFLSGLLQSFGLLELLSLLAELFDAVLHLLVLVVLLFEILKESSEKVLFLGGHASRLESQRP